MAYWIVSLVCSKKGKLSITIPKAWAKRSLRAQDRFLFLKETDNGKLEIMSEEEYFDQKLRERELNKNKGAGGPAAA